MAVIDSVQLPGLGVKLKLRDYVDDAMFASADVSHGQATDLQVFTASRGQPRPGAGSTLNTDLDTNIIDPGRLPTGWLMYVFGIGIETPANIAASDLQSIMGLLLFELWIVNKAYSEGHLGNYPYGGGMTGSASTTQNDTVIQNWTNGVPAAGARRMLAIPHKIGSGETFFGKIRFPETGPTFANSEAKHKLTVHLFGIIGRGVQ